jgi:hypothetical protein
MLVRVARHHGGDLAPKALARPFLGRVGADRLLQGGGEQPVLAAEIAVDQRRIDAGIRRDVAQEGAVIAGLGEVLFGGFQDAGTSRFGITLARRAVRSEGDNVCNSGMTRCRSPEPMSTGDDLSAAGYGLRFKMLGGTRGQSPSY